MARSTVMSALPGHSAVKLECLLLTQSGHAACADGFRFDARPVLERIAPDVRDHECGIVLM